MRVCLSNLGCKLNQAEVDSMARRFLARGDEIVATVADADLHVVNSCTVTHAAARDSRKTVRRANRLRPEVKTVVTGCWATDSSEEAGSLEGVDMVVDNSSKADLVDLVHERFAGSPGFSSKETAIPVSFVPLRFGPTRGLVKIEDGCNMRCSFCIIPSTRGRQRSRSVAEVVREVRGLVEAGYREIVVTGVQISAYRSDGARLVDLVEALLEHTDVGRLRLTSIAPWDFDSRLLDLLKGPRLCRHLHFSLQSGCGETLRRMRRPYTPEQFRRLAALTRGEVAGLALTTDVIVGFPGESDAEFAASLDFVEETAFARAHVFNYSVRAGTEAATMSGKVDDRRRKERVRRMLEVASESELRFRVENLGSEATVLWEECRGGSWRGMTDNYIRVFTVADGDLQGRFGLTMLTGLTGGGMSARARC